MYIGFVRKVQYSSIHNNKVKKITFEIYYKCNTKIFK